MFYCQRCESSFNETVAAVAGKCPRCLSKDGVSVPIRYRLFESQAPKVTGSVQPAQAQHAAQQCLESS